MEANKKNYMALICRTSAKGAIIITTHFADEIYHQGSVC